MKKRNAIKTDLFADEHHRKKIDALGDPHSRPGSCQLCNDDDGGQLQPEAAGVFQEGRNRGFLTPIGGRIAGARSEETGEAAKKAGIV